MITFPKRQKLSKIKLVKLTYEQKLLMSEVRDYWINKAIGGDCSYNHARIIDGVNFVYSIARLRKPKFVFIVESPLGAQILSNGVSVMESVRASVGDPVRKSVRASVWDPVMESVRASVWDPVRKSMWSSMRDSVKFDSNGLGYDSGWIAYCDFFRKIKVLSNEKFDKYVDFVEAGIWDCISYKHIAVVCIRPMRVHKNSENRLHNPSGAAVSWKDGYENYFINGVKVSKEFVMTPAEKLDPHIILTEKNMEIRREIVRKIGMERIILKLGAKSIDKQGEYELLLFNVGDGRKRPYLKMRNPSIQTWHIEGVPPGTQSVSEALNFRKPKELAIIPIADNGSDWYQQGDVCIWPTAASFVKPSPKILT